MPKLMQAATLLLLLTTNTGAAVADDKPAAKPNDLATQLIGTWKLQAAAEPGRPSGIGTRLKMFTGTHWSVVQPDPATGLLVFQHGGEYEVVGNAIRAKTSFAGRSTKGLLGRTHVITLHVEGDTMSQVDSAGVFNEIWKRVQPAEPAKRND